jgi:hypothetical protein
MKSQIIARIQRRASLEIDGETCSVWLWLSRYLDESAGEDPQRSNIGIRWIDNRMFHFFSCKACGGPVNVLV